MKIAIYLPNFYVVGGTESAIYYFCKHFKDEYDITVYYSTIDSGAEQLNRLASVVKCEKYLNNNITTDLLIICGWTKNKLDYMFNHTTAKYKIFWSHLPAKSAISVVAGVGYNDVIAVSEDAKNEWESYGYNPKVLYTPVDINNNYVKEVNKVKLITASRMSPEKGANRVINLANYLNISGVNFDWDIYSDHHEKFPSIPNVYIKQPKLDIVPELLNSDIVVQLSDRETFGLTIYEALLLNKGVVVTPINSFKEMKAPNNLFSTLNYDCSNLSDVANFIRNYSTNNNNYKGIYSGWDRYLYRLQNKIEGVENKTKVYLVKGKLEYEITDKDYLVITDTEQASNINYIMVDSIDSLTKENIIKIINS